MAQIFVKYNPYRMETQIEINGKEVSKDSILYKIVKGKRLQEWVGKFPEMLVAELNTVDFDIEFYGMSLDWDDFEDSFTQAKKNKVIKNLNIKFIEGKSDEDINNKISIKIENMVCFNICNFMFSRLLSSIINLYSFIPLTLSVSIVGM